MAEKTEIKKPWNILLTILLIPVMCIFLIVLLIGTPFDYIKYRSSRYYKDTKEKYSWLCTTSYYISLYNLIKKENLPIAYYRCTDVPLTGYGYFVYQDMLLLNDYEPCYDEEKQTWLVEVEDEYVDLESEVEAVRARCNQRLGREVCKKAVVLIDKELLEAHPNAQYETIRLLPVSDSCDVDALKKLTSQ